MTHAVIPHLMFQLPLRTGHLLGPIKVGVASSALWPEGWITIRKVGWAWPGVPLGLTCIQRTVRLRQFTLGVGACLQQQSYVTWMEK